MFYRCISASVILIKVLLKKQSGRFNPAAYGGSSTIPQPPQFFSLRSATLIFSDYYSCNLTLFWKVSINGIVSSSQTFYYLIWKNSKKVTKTAKSENKIVKKWVKILWHQLKALVSLLKALVAIMYNYVCSFVLSTISFDLLCLYSLYNFLFSSLFLVQLYFVQLWFPPLFHLVNGIKTRTFPA